MESDETLDLAFRLVRPLLAEMENRMTSDRLVKASVQTLQNLSGLATKLMRAMTPIAKELRSAREAAERAGARLSRSERAVLFAEWAGKELRDEELLATVQALTQALNERRQAG